MEQDLSQRVPSVCSLGIWLPTKILILQTVKCEPPDRVSGASQQIKNSLISQLLHFLNAEGSKGENITMSPAGEIMSVLHVVYNEDRMEHGYCHRIIKIEFVHGINLFCRFPVRWGSNGHL